MKSIVWIEIGLHRRHLEPTPYSAAMSLFRGFAGLQVDGWSLTTCFSFLVNHVCIWRSIERSPLCYSSFCFCSFGVLITCFFVKLNFLALLHCELALIGFLSVSLAHMSPTGQIMLGERCLIVPSFCHFEEIVTNPTQCREASSSEVRFRSFSCVAFLDVTVKPCL